MVCALREEFLAVLWTSSALASGILHQSEHVLLLRITCRGPRAQVPGPEAAVPLENSFFFLPLGCPDTASFGAQLWQELCFLKALCLMSRGGSLFSGLWREAGSLLLRVPQPVSLGSGRGKIEAQGQST